MGEVQARFLLRSDSHLDRIVPEWMTVETDSRKVTIDDLPSREQIDTDIQEQLIVELYSK